MFPQRHARLLRFEIPTRGLERRLRHAMTAYRPEQFEYLSRALNLFVQHHRTKKLRQRRPRSVRPLAAIKRSLTGRALTPPLGAVGISDSRQNDAPLSSTTKASFEKVDERQANLAQFNRLDKQSRNLFLRDTHYARARGVLTTMLPVALNKNSFRLNAAASPFWLKRCGFAA